MLIVCCLPAAREAAATDVVAGVVTVGAGVAGVVGWVTGAPCASWPVRSAVRYSGPWDAVTRTPILLVSLRYEPNTPLRSAQVAERRLGNAVLLVEDGPGHLVANNPSACVDAAMGRYLVHLRTPRPGTVCAPDHAPFDPAFGQG